MTDTNTLRPEISRIIESGTQSPTIDGSAKPVFLCGAAAMLMQWMSFSPMEFAPLAWVSIVPLCLLLRLKQLPRYSNRLLMFAGFIGSLVTLQWMRLGHVSMYGALVALSFYLSLYLPAFVAIGRRLVAAGIPVWLAGPLVWTALEYLRAHLLTGFSWYYLGHTQFAWTEFVQIADLTGAWGVSFVVALSSGVVASLIPLVILKRWGLAADETNVVVLPLRSQQIGVATLLGLVMASCAYGMSRMRSDSDAQPGPVIAVVQGNFTPEVKHDPNKWLEMVRQHDLLTGKAARLRPDLIVWPETMFPAKNRVIADGITDDELRKMLPPESSMNSEQVADEIKRWRNGYAQELLANRSQEAGAAMLVGLITEEAEADKRSQFNSAAFVRPDLGYVGRYDKIHRVIFGEYIPLKQWLPFLAKASPYGGGFGIDAGHSAKVFEYAGTRYAPIICFEDTVPHLVRDTVLTTHDDGAAPDVLINMTNDGWFRGSSELDQHLITATFRCIETRRPMIRAVNAGISAFIDANGRIRQPEHFFIMDDETAGVSPQFVESDSLIDKSTGRRFRQCSAVMCGQVPLDGRNTVYLQFGDWFAILCSAVTVLGLLKNRFLATSQSQSEPAPGSAASASLNIAA